MTTGREPSLGGGRYQPDPRRWRVLIGPNLRQRTKQAVEIKSQGAAERYATFLLEALPDLNKRQRLNAGESLALLGDPRLEGSPVMRHVSGGIVVMGSSEAHDERPVHRVEVGPFEMATMPITEAGYAEFVSAAGYEAPRHWPGGMPPSHTLNYPVTHVSAYDAEAYCRWLSEETGTYHRLPTEAEWVMAARGTESDRRFPWGDTFGESRANAWSRRPLKQVCPVGLFPEGAGPHGHLGLAGNVWEWCSSAYWIYPYDRFDGREEPGEDDRRVLHGGSWRSRPLSVRCAARQGEWPSDSFNVVGFRVVRTV